VAGLITVADWADHYSQMAIYLRLNGLLPRPQEGHGLAVSENLPGAL